ncbi:MAG: transglycosylase SLT domain-containing protein [Acidiferrobacterales bacterium]
MMPRFKLCFIVLAVVLQGAAVSARAADQKIEQDRQDYLSAIAALRSGDLGRFRELEGKLDGYVLRSYLQYYYLEDRIPSTPASTLSAFIAQNQDAPISNMLRHEWLHYLAKRGHWKIFVEQYQDVDEDSALNCDRLAFLLRTVKQRTALMNEIGQLWMTGESLPDACNPVFAAWRRAGNMTRDKVWRRIRLAMKHQDLTLAADLKWDLPANDRIWVDRWLAMYRAPQRELNDIRYPVETPLAREIIRQGVVRLAYIDPAQAMKTWSDLKNRYQFFGEDNNYVLRRVGILAAQDHLPQAVDWLSQASVDTHDGSLGRWRVRAALRAGKWHTALRFIEDLGSSEQRQDEWLYWKARMLEKAGDESHALRIFTELAKERSYYGFLAADRLGRRYAMQRQRIQPTPEEISAMLARPSIEMAKELFMLGETVDARRQWAWATRNMDGRDLQVAAVLARQWGWYDRAILTAARSDNLNDLGLRFPVLYRNMIETNAQDNGIDPSWVYGILRQESGFMTDARSDVGALGLMQLMPRTGWLAGLRIHLFVRTDSAILNVANNLRLGTSYLKTVLDDTGGHEVLATAAYNAGPNRIMQWLPQEHKLDADTWVDTIPYRETRNYVKNVMAFSTVYAYLLGDKSFTLDNAMTTVLPASGGAPLLRAKKQ